MQQYNLWFVNQSSNSGKVCVYQDEKNVASNRGFDILAWQLTGANKSVMIKFIWTIDYNFAWFEYAPIRTEQIESANLSTTNSIVLSHNSDGFYFQQPQPGNPSDSLYIAQDKNIPSGNCAYVGIGMHGAGTFARQVTPNLDFTFTPASSSKLKYYISFGQYTFEVNDPIQVKAMNNPGEISFPNGVYTMTATLSTSHSWNIVAGEPVTNVDALSEVIVYDAGKGVIS